MQSIDSSFTEPVDAPRNGLLLRVLIGFVKVLQDARQRKAGRVLANYQQLIREIEHRPTTHFF
jgi:hypothetical protein